MLIYVNQLLLILIICESLWSSPAVNSWSNEIIRDGSVTGTEHEQSTNDLNIPFDFKLLPMSLSQIRRLVRNAPDEAVRGEIRRRGINFRPTLEIIDELKVLGAKRLAIDLLRTWISNRPPSVALSINKSQADQGEKLRIYAEATDPDEDELEYSWSSSHGTIEKDVHGVKLDTADISIESDETNVTISLSVNDRKGGTDSVNKSVIVRRLDPVKAWRDGEHILVCVAGAHYEAPAKKGALEVELVMTGNATETIYVTGRLPGLPCRIDLVAQGDNIAEFSMKESPGASNSWRRITVSILPRNPKRTIRFAINWQILEAAL